MNTSNKHKPVLLSESIAALAIKPDGIYVDATFGRGGHSQAILSNLNENGKLLCIDKDNEAIQTAIALNDKRLIIRHGSFANLENWVNELDLNQKIDGILLDLGVSSPQLDNPDRGFSFLRDGPLDMRMNQEQKLDAASWIARAKEDDIAFVLKTYGEERFGKRIANAIVRERDIAPILTTGRLAEIVKIANPKWEKHKNPATRAFQGIRIFINNELQDLQDCLDQCLKVLRIGGHLVVISFHSLEDRMVKNFIQKHAKGLIPDSVPMLDSQLDRNLKRIGKAVHASDAEVDINPRSRSAILRIAEKLK